MATVIPSTVLSALSGYGLYLSYQNITRLQQYEEQSEKAAEWSNTAANRLHKTRTTQTSGTVTLLISLVTTVTLLFTGLSKSSLLIPAAFVNGAALFASRTHMANFWNDKKQVRVPFVGKFNGAIKGSEQVVEVLKLLSYAWVSAGLTWFLGWPAVFANVGFVVNVGILTWFILGPGKGVVQEKSQTS